MREIKFRAWDNRHKRMYPFELIELPYNENVTLDGQFAGLIDMEYEFMQYTGFKDKNGVEIYEGDILYYPAHEGHVCVKYALDMFHLKSLGNFRLAILHSRLEVIGNKYENPELLQE